MSYDYDTTSDSDTQSRSMNLSPARVTPATKKTAKAPAPAAVAEELSDEFSGWETDENDQTYVTVPAAAAAAAAPMQIECHQERRDTNCSSSSSGDDDDDDADDESSDWETEEEKEEPPVQLVEPEPAEALFDRAKTLPSVIAGVKRLSQFNLLLKQDANLVKMLGKRGAQFTVFAPVDDSPGFGDVRKQLKGNSVALDKFLKAHIFPVRKGIDKFLLEKTKTDVISETERTTSLDNLNEDVVDIVATAAEVKIAGVKVLDIDTLKQKGGIRAFNGWLYLIKGMLDAPGVTNLGAALPARIEMSQPQTIGASVFSFGGSNKKSLFAGKTLITKESLGSAAIGGGAAVQA